MVACCIRVWNLTNCCEMITMFKILNVYTTGNPGKQLEAVIPTFAMSEENGRCANVVRKKKKINMSYLLCSRHFASLCI